MREARDIPFVRYLKRGIIGALVFVSGYYMANVRAHNHATVLYSLDTKNSDQAIVQMIDSADRFVYFAVYTFTKRNIADALARAKDRGVEVHGITDAGQAENMEEVAVIEALQQAGILVETQKHPQGIMHIKALVTEKAYAMGSYNWTWSATNINDEILEIGDDEAMRLQYENIIKKVLEANT